MRSLLQKPPASDLGETIRSRRQHHKRTGGIDLTQPGGVEKRCVLPTMPWTPVSAVSAR
jgi:hypothetical protein